MPRILVKRKGALGDVLEVSAITHRLRCENPDAVIAVQTDYPQIFLGNQDVNEAAESTDREDWDRTIDLNMAFENQLRKMSGLNAYSLVAFGDTNTPRRLYFQWDYMEAKEDGPYVVLHAARSWPIRTLPKAFWQELIDILVERHYKVILTGTSQDWDGLQKAFDLRDKLNLRQQVGIIDMADCFIASESGPNIFAQLTRTPVIALCTMIDPDFITYERYGQTGWRYYPIRANVPCVGCALEQTEPNTYFDCRHGEGSPEFRSCLTAFDPTVIADKVDEVRVARAK